MSNARSTGDVEGLFERALALPPARRGAFLDHECAGDPARRERLERLLRFAESDDGFLERSPLQVPADVRTAATLHSAGQLIGAYRLLRRLGAGGTAEVWLAERTEGGFQQRAAVKIVRDAQGSLRERFVAEREILASLAHPGIARLYDGGVQANGFAYMIMEYVEGEHLGAYARAHSLSLSERLALFLQVCDAVAYAHTRLVVHRDIKPANILVTADGHAKLLDFGIAKLLNTEPTRDVTGTLHMSPAYAAPEQLTGDYVSTATDVYALGVTLYELLTGRLPWSDDNATLATAVKRLMDTSIPPPSRAAAQGSPIPTRVLRGDLDAIVARTLRKEPGARYPDARALADDIRRHLDHQPVQARAGARAYVARRFLRRNWLALATAAAVFVAMSIALVAIVWQAQKARHEAQRAAAVQDFMIDLFRRNSGRQSDPVRARQTTARELLEVGARRIETSLADAPENKLVLLRLFGDLYAEFALTSEQLPVRRQAVALSRSFHGGDSPELAGDLIALAKIEPDRTEAAKLLAEAGAILDRRHDAQSLLRGRWLMTSAGQHYTTESARARGEIAQAVSILDAFPDSADLAHALFLEGMIDYSVGSGEEAIGPLQRAIDVSLSTEGTTSPMLSTYYRQLGEVQSYLLQHAAAEASVQRAIAQAQAYHDENNYDLVRAETTMAVVLMTADRPKDSLEFAAKAKADAATTDTQILPDDSSDAAYVKIYAFNAGSRTEIRAGELDGALADAQAAVKLAREVDPQGNFLVSSLQREAEALVELGKCAQAAQPLSQAAELLKRIGRPYSEFDAMMRIRVALDEKRANDARAILAAMPPVDAKSPKAIVSTIRRDLVQAEIDLAGGDLESAARRASAVSARARASDLATSLRSAIADAELLEGIARTRSEDARGACPILADAVATRVDLYLPKSPKIAQSKLALAECERSRGRHREATDLIAQARAILARHSSLSARYVNPFAGER